MPPAAGRVGGDAGTARWRRPSDLPGRTNPFAVSDVRSLFLGIAQRRGCSWKARPRRRASRSTKSIPAPYRAAYDSAMATLASTKIKAER